MLRSSPLRRNSCLLLAAVLCAFGAAPAATAVDPGVVTTDPLGALSCETDNGGTCAFLCVPGTFITVASTGSSPGHEVHVSAICNGETVSSCHADSGSCGPESEPYLGPLVIGSCESGAYNKGSCTSDTSAIFRE